MTTPDSIQIEEIRCALIPDPDEVMYFKAPRRGSLYPTNQDQQQHFLNNNNEFFRIGEDLKLNNTHIV
jgi:hypothetical protein